MYMCMLYVLYSRHASVHVPPDHQAEGGRSEDGRGGIGVVRGSANVPHPQRSATSRVLAGGDGTAHTALEIPQRMQLARGAGSKASLRGLG